MCECHPASEMVAHAPLEPSMPFTLDLLDAVEDDGDFVIAGTCRTPIERHESGTQLARRWRPARRRRLPRRRRQNAAQRCKVIGRPAQRSKTAYEKGNPHGCPRNVGVLDDQLQSRPVGTQGFRIAPNDLVLAVDADVVLVAVEAFLVLLRPACVFIFCAFLPGFSSHPSGVFPL